MLKIYLDVPYKLKDYAKNYGCKWDSFKKRWYCYEDNIKAIEDFSKKRNRNWKRSFEVDDEETKVKRDFILNKLEILLDYLETLEDDGLQYLTVYIDAITSFYNNAVCCRGNTINWISTSMIDYWKWDKLEKDYSIDRKQMKKFLKVNKLKSPVLLIDEIRSHYEPSRKRNLVDGFVKAKERSQKQEKLWESRLKDAFPNIKAQYREDDCIYDFIDFENKIIFECKLSVCYISDEQFLKYQQKHKDFYIIYLIEDNEIHKVKWVDEVDFGQRHLKTVDVITSTHEDNYFEKIIYYRAI